MWEPNIPCFHCVPIDFRASDTFALTQTDETARAAYAATNRAALQAERDRLRLVQLEKTATVQSAGSYPTRNY